MLRHPLLLALALVAGSCTDGSSSNQDASPKRSDASRSGVAPGHDSAVGQAITWTTQRYALTADAFHIDIDGVQFTAQAAASDIRIGGDPGNPTRMTVEVSWREHGVEMRLNIYLVSDGTDWWADEISTFEGRENSEWIYYSGEFFRTPLGTQFAGDVDLTSDPGQEFASSIHFENLRLSVFEPPAECGIVSDGYVLTSPFAQVEITPPAFFRTYVMLRDAETCEPIADQSAFTYSWSVANPDIARIAPEAVCINGAENHCPETVVEIHGSTPGATLIRAIVSETATGAEVARAVIPVFVN